MSFDGHFLPNRLGALRHGRRAADRCLCHLSGRHSPGLCRVAAGVHHGLGHRGGGHRRPALYDPDRLDRGRSGSNPLGPLGPDRCAWAGPGPDRHAGAHRRLRRLPSGAGPGAHRLDRGARARGPAGLRHLHRGLPAGRGRAPGGAARHHALALVRRARRGLSGHPRRGGPDLHSRRRRLDLGRRHRRHRLDALPGGGRFQSGARHRRGAPPGRLRPAPRRPVAIQRAAGTAVGRPRR